MNKLNEHEQNIIAALVIGAFFGVAVGLFIGLLLGVVLS